MRRLVLPALLLALAISVGAGDDAAGAAASTAGNGAVQVTLQLAATTVTSGSVLSGRLTIVNGSHKPIRYVTCGSFIQILLRNHDHLLSPGWLLCSAPLTLPTGTSSYPVSVVAAYNECAPTGAWGTHVACLRSGGMPPLPPGVYQATTYLVPAVPVPPPITITVTAG
ncbi:MAG TPA: hypothetical protein VEV45_13140 [Streptosporangiaceae bacterium]|nr:hypothetical protein [Streptosporangiaceae bacterium]